MTPQHMRNPIPNSPTEGGGGGESQAAGAGADTPAGGGGAESVSGGGEAGEWYKDLPDDLRSAPVVLRHKTQADAITSLVAAEAKLGVPANQLVRLPTKPDDTEALAAISKALGAPETPDGYKFELGETISEVDRAAVGEFAKSMHAAGLGAPPFIKAAVEWWSGEVARQETAAIEEAKAATEAGVAALKTEWGAAFKERSEAVGKLIADLGGEDLAKELNASNLGDSPALAKLLGKIVEKMAESGPTGDGQNADLGAHKLTPGQARNALAELEGDEAKRKALLDETHPQHKAIVAERQRLLLLANPQVAPTN